MWSQVCAAGVFPRDTKSQTRTTLATEPTMALRKAGLGLRPSFNVIRYWKRWIDMSKNTR